MMTSTLTMTSGRNNSQRRLASLASCNKHNAGYSGSPVLLSDLDLDPLIKSDPRKSDADESNNNRSASDYLSKLLSSRDFSNDFDGSPSTLSNSEANGFSYIPMKTGSSITASTRSSSMQKGGASSQKKNSRTSHSHKHKPAEVFRKDLISAMKLPDNSQLLHEEYWEMQDAWRIEWEKGVQVPVNQKAIPSRHVRSLSKETHGDFRMPRKMVKSSPEPGDKDMVDLNVLADSTCRYDLDGLDVLWLKEVNIERKCMGLKPLDEFSMEQIMEELEIQCHDNLQLAIQTKEGLGIEYDENIVCDVCRSLECEEGNEMVFCDGCNLCVHQACYGILKVPEGSWLCKPCALGIRGSAVCILCDRKGGAMKSTRSGNKWAHVSCALWIPEIKIADADRMEPITKVSLVPSSRWALLCSICKQRVGACIQCNVKNCVTAYHVTCAVEAKLDMDADCGSSSSEDGPVIFKSFCKKHSTGRKDSDEEEEQDKEEKRSQRHRRIMELEEGFYAQVKASAVASNLSVPEEIAERVIIYWTLKRRINFNKPLITPRNEEDTALAEAAATNLQRRLLMFTHLRQDLERVRNLCYMIGRREKTKKATVKNMESVFLTQMKVLERRMGEESNYDSVRMVPFLKKFGKAEVCELARKETVILERTSDWSQTATDTENRNDGAMPTNEEGPRSHRTERNSSSGMPRIKPRTKVKGDADKSDLNAPTDQLRNGLHRKAFATACQKREVLLRRNRRKSSNHDTNTSSKEHVSKLSPRKRSHNSDFDFENLPSMKDVGKKSCLETNSTDWPTTKTSPAHSKAPSNEPDLVRSDALSSKTNRIGTRRTRSASVYSDASDLNIDATINKRTSNSPKAMQQVQKVTEPRLSLSENHLIVKWDSDQNDDNPDIVEKSTVEMNRTLSLTEETIATSIKKDAPQSSNSDQSSFVRRLTRSSHQSEKSLNDQHKKSSSSRTPRRLSASKAKNDSAALAPSCKSGSHVTEEEEQGLRKLDHPTHNDPPSSKLLNNRRTSGGTSSKDASHPSKNLGIQHPQKEEEDGGYRGDMDESDADAPSPSRHKAMQSRHRSTLIEDILSKSTDTSESYYGEDRLQLSPRKRRLKSRMHVERKVSLVAFQGFKDLDDESCSDESKAKIMKRSPASIETNSLNKELISEPDVVDKEQTSLSPLQTEQNARNETSLPELQTKSPEIEAVTDSAVLTGDNQVQSIPSTPVDVGVTLQDDSNADFTHQFYSSAQNYPAAFYGSNMSMVNMSYLQQQQNYFYQSQFYPYWPPPPPPPPPPDDSSPQHPTDSVEQVVESTAQLMQDPTLSVNQLHPASSAQCNQPDNMSLQVPFYPIVSDPSVMNPNLSEVQAHQSSLVMDEATAERHEASTKKKKKKSKKKKKKKKRKRKHSRIERDSNSDMFSSASGGSDEYCIEYCSTLVEPTEETSTHVDIQPTEEIAENYFPELDSSEKALPSTSSMPPPSDTGPDQSLSKAQSENHEESKLLLKIDKKMFTSSTQIKSSGGSDSSPEESYSPVEEKPKEKPFVTPLKLKLCGLKSDRTLRGGLVAREYQILEVNPSDSPDSKPDVETPSAVEKSSPKLKSLVEPQRTKPSPKSHSKSAKQSNKSTKSVPQKKNSSKEHASTSISPARSTTISGLPTSLPQSKTLSTTQGQLSQTKPKQQNSIPERHWKKRKLHVHEASVTTSAASGGKPQPLTNVKNLTTNQPSSNTSSHTTTIATNHSSKLLPGEDEAKSKRTNHASTSTLRNESTPLPAKSTKPTQPRRKKALDSNKSGSDKNSFRALSSLPSVSPYKFTVSKTHQKKVAAASIDSPDKTKEDKADAVKTLGDDPYAFSDFGGT